MTTIGRKPKERYYPLSNLASNAQGRAYVNVSNISKLLPKINKGKWQTKAGKDMIDYELPAIHAKYYNCVLLMAKGNNILQTFLQVKFSHRPLWAEILRQHTYKTDRMKMIVNNL